jgi:hypothetical protein
VQSQFYWGGHGYQYGPTFNQKEYNQVAAPETPFGLQQGFTPLTGQQINDIIAGKQVSGPVSPNATRVEQYRADTRTPPSYGQVELKPAYKTTAGSVAPTNTNNVSDAQYNRITEVLGPNWFNRQQAAAQAGDWETYNMIQNQINNILNPPSTATGSVAPSGPVNFVTGP